MVGFEEGWGQRLAEHAAPGVAGSDEGWGAGLTEHAAPGVIERLMVRVIVAIVLEGFCNAKIRPTQCQKRIYQS